jgi:hypothetical protein
MYGHCWEQQEVKKVGRYVPIFVEKEPKNSFLTYSSKIFPIVYEHCKGEREVEEDNMHRENKQSMEGFLFCMFPDTVPNSVWAFFEMPGLDEYRGESDPEKS